MEIEERPIGSIRPYENNPRMNDAGVEAVAASIGEAEFWQAVPGYEGLYDVSSVGRVRRASRSRMAPAGHILKLRMTWDGYPTCALSKHQRYWHVKVHRLVALAFLGPAPFPKAHVAHFDGDKTNNCIANLRWATPAENEADKQRHGRARGAQPGEQHHLAKLTVEVVSAMRTRKANGTGVNAIAAEFGIPIPTAWDAIRGRTWGTVTDPPPILQARRKEICT